MSHDYEGEVDRNYDAFTAKLPGLLASHRGEFALMQSGDIVEFAANAADALRCGHQRFGDCPFSIQEITDRPVDLGFFSHAIDTRLA